MADENGPDAETGDAPVGPRDVNPADRFTLGGKPLDLGEIVAASMGDLADRTPVAAEPQPDAQPFSTIWGARRPVPNPAEDDLPPEADPLGDDDASENES